MRVAPRTHPACRATLWVVVSVAATACSVLAGFDDLHKGCPPGLTLGASGNVGAPTCIASGGAGGTRGAGGAREAGVVIVGTDDAGQGDAAAGGRAGSAGGPPSGGSSSGGGPGATSMRAAACAGKLTRGSPMAPVVRADGSSFLIDRTEVTFGQYADFLASNPPVSVDPGCPVRDAGSVPRPRECELLLEQRDAGNGVDPELPQVCIDWCDAAAYCKWVGKELCPDTTQLLSTSELAMESDFYAACASDGSRYGCGPGCGSTSCNGHDAMNGKAEPVGATTGCFVGEPDCSVSDLSGNVAEWTRACLLNTPDGKCAVRGGSYDSTESDLRCTSITTIPRRTVSVTVGFRCCVDPWDG